MDEFKDDEYGVEYKRKDVKYGFIQSVGIPKLLIGSTLYIGKNYTVSIRVDHHFNWFQKKCIKFFFGIIVVDYSEEVDE